MLSRIAAAYRGEGKTDAKGSRISADQARMRHDLFPVRAKPEQVVAADRVSAKYCVTSCDLGVFV
jgi:histidine ammonia-lyase